MKAEIKQVAAIYVRVSTEEQAKEGYSIPAQIETLTQYCKLYNIAIYKIYRDLGISGKNINSRPALNELLNDSAENRFNCVIVWKISRLSRNLKDLLYLVDKLESRNVSFISYSEKFDTSVPVGRMTLQILGSIAEFERNTIIENVKLGLEQSAKEGKWTGNHVFGYDNIDKKIVINPKEAEIVKRIFSMYLDKNMGLRKIAITLNQEGYKTKRNALFGHDYISRILSNPVYKGYVRHQTRPGKPYYEVKGIHESIISEEIFALAQEKLASRDMNWSRSFNNFILVGILKCPKCGYNMVSKYGQYRGKTYRYYQCSKYHREGKQACSPNTINADKIESAVLDKLKEIVNYPHIVRAVINEAQKSKQAEIKPEQSILESLNNEIQNLNSIKDKYFKLFENDKITPDMFSDRLNEIQTQIDALNKQKLQYDNIPKDKDKSINITEEEVIKYLSDFLNVFNKVSTEDKRKLLHDLIQAINLDGDKNLKSIELKFPLREGSLILS
jgi:site-specific DNA recombinase